MNTLKIHLVRFPPQSVRHPPLFALNSSKCFHLTVQGLFPHTAWLIKDTKCIHSLCLVIQLCIVQMGAMKINKFYANRVHFCELNFRECVINSFRIFKGLVHPKMKMMSLITHPHVVPTPRDLRSSSEHKLRFFLLNQRALWPS